MLTQISSVLMSDRIVSTFYNFVMLLLPQKEEKSQQHKVCNSSADCPPAQTPPPPKASSPDALKGSLESLATVSNINIDIKLKEEDEDLVKRQVQKAQSVVSHHWAGNEHATHSVYKDSKGGVKPDPFPPPSPVKPPLRSVSGVDGRGGDKRRASNGLLDIQPQAEPDPGDKCSVSEEKQMSDVDAKDDTMELLKEAELQNPKLQVEKDATFFIHEGSGHISNMGNFGGVVDMNTDNQHDTVNLLKGSQTKHQHTPNVQVSAYGISGFLRNSSCLFYVSVGLKILLSTFVGQPGIY